MIKLLQLRSSEIAEFIFSIRYIGRRENQDKNIVFNNIFINAYNSITDYGQDIFWNVKIRNKNDIICNASGNNLAKQTKYK